MKNRSVTSFQLPLEYGENVIQVLVQSPNCIFVYWELGREYKDMATRHFKTAWAHLSLYLRLYEANGRYFDGKNAQQYSEYPIEPHCSSYYFSPVKAGKAYLIDLGVKKNGKFLSLLRSKVIMTPLDRESSPQKEVDLEPVFIQLQKSVDKLPTSGQ